MLQHPCFCIMHMRQPGLHCRACCALQHGQVGRAHMLLLQGSSSIWWTIIILQLLAPALVAPHRNKCSLTLLSLSIPSEEHTAGGAAEFSWTPWNVHLQAGLEPVYTAAAFAHMCRATNAGHQGDDCGHHVLAARHQARACLGRLPSSKSVLLFSTCCFMSLRMLPVCCYPAMQHLHCCSSESVNG